jgi:hypothetical protein
MSFAALHANLMMVIAMEYDGELQQQFLMQHKLYLQKAVNGFMDIKAEHEPGSQADKILQARIHQLNEAEKILEVRLQNLQNRSKALGNIRENISKQISENIQRTFQNAYSGR